MDSISGILGTSEHLSVWGFAIRTILVGILLWAEGKVLPHRSGGQFGGYDFAFFWMMGGVTASPLFDSKLNFLNTITIIVIIYLLHYLLSYLAVKNRTFAKFLIGQPVVVISHGKVIRQNIAKALLPLEMLLSELRVSDAPNLNEVETAVMETSGHVSVLKRSEVQPATPAELSLPTPHGGLPNLLINDGQVIRENLTQIGHDESWLMKQLGKNGIRRVEDVYVALIDRTGTFHYSVKT
jgi:uncharacterized membrane protein YcaP (DUF421 family)